MMRDFLAYAEFAGFWERFRPETPFGREEKDRLEVHADARTLEAIWDRTDCLIAFLASLGQDAVRLSRITHHLKRLPRFPEEARPIYDEVELFQFKKFLHNYKQIGGMLPADVQAAFGFHYQSEGFERLMDVGRQSAESFFVADEYSEDLASVRTEIRKADEALARVRQRRQDEIRERWDLAFGFKEFLLVARERLGDAEAAAGLLLVEPYDEMMYAVRPRTSAEELVLAERRTSLLGRERACEEEVLERLSWMAREELPRFLAYREVVRAFDLALARARLAIEHGLVRPVLTGGPIRIEQGRFLPCEEACRALDTPYTPLDVVVDARVTVVFGSNMGGKTIALKSVAFLQLCAQTGLFVPAARFETRVFAHFHYLGEGCAREQVQGLSGFGFEIRQLTRAWDTLSAPSLVLFDEFARTTSSHEAEAILSAVIEELVRTPQVAALFSTHFRGVRRIEGARYLRMQGLDRAALGFAEADGATLDERIRLINNHMEHHLVPDDASRTVSDAIAVAALLGIDPGIARRAEHFFQARTQE